MGGKRQSTDALLIEHLGILAKLREDIFPTSAAEVQKGKRQSESTTQ